MKGRGPADDDGLTKASEAVDEGSGSGGGVTTNPAVKGLHSPRSHICRPQSPLPTYTNESLGEQDVARSPGGKTTFGEASACELSSAVPARQIGEKNHQASTPSGVQFSAPHIDPSGHLGVAGVPSQTPAVCGSAHIGDGSARDGQVPVRSEQSSAATSELSTAGNASVSLVARDGSTSLPVFECTQDHEMEASVTSPSADRTSPSPKLGSRGSARVDEAKLDGFWTTEEGGVAPGERSRGEAANPTAIGAVAQASPAAKPRNSGIDSGSDSQEAVASQSLPHGMSPSTECLAPLSADGRRAEDKSSEPPLWEEPVEPDSPGDTADIAMAAVSYANSVAERGAVGNPNGTTPGPTPTASNHTCDGPSIAPAASKNDTPCDVAVSPGSLRERDETGPAATVGFAQTGSRTSSNSEPVFNAAAISGAAVATSGSTRTSSRRKTGLRGSDHHDDMMHAMCMICLEKLSDVTERGGAKMLGLLDSCSHRYCYTCILEWSKITNKCPQCKARFHTIKAIKELRRNNHRYRGVAVRVEDRDQVYSFVDVRDVVVLDPDVACHTGCLVRRGVDALQQGWEFSVQCEQCSKWYHGLCVGFRREWEVPDLWFCRPCRGESYGVASNPDGVSEPAAAGARQASSGADSNGRGHTGGQPPQGHDVVNPLVSGQGRATEVASSGCQVHEQDSASGSTSSVSRTPSDRRQGTSEVGALAEVAEPQAPPIRPAPPARLEDIESPPPRPPSAAEAPGQVIGAPYGSPQWSSVPPRESLPSLFDPQQDAPANSTPVLANSDPPSSPPAAAPSARGRGRPRGSRNKPASARSPPVPLPAPGSTMVPAPSATPHSTQSPPPTGAGAPSRSRGRPRGSKNKPPPQPTASEGQPGSHSAPPTSVNPTALPSQENEQQQQQNDSARPHAETSVTTERVLHSDAISRPPEPPAPSFLQSLEALEVTDLCAICGFDTEPDNLIVYCSSCDMGVHQTCYGISEIPTKEWYCSPCSAGVHPSTLACRFCPIKGGALKRCTDESWGHILCAFWIPECCFLDPQQMEPIGSINRKGQAGGVEKFLPAFRSRKCYVCGTSAGSAIRCHTSSCKFHLHPMCGSKAGSIYMEIETTTKKGADGTEHESVNLVARCPRHNKTKAKGGAGFKSRGTIIGATADPLSVIGRMLEIADPKGGIALTGKVTWFNSESSKYCIVASRHSGEGGSGGGCTGSGDPKEGCSHWITVDKLVKARAMGVQKNGKRLLLKPLPSVEGERAGISKEKGYQENRVKIEENGEARKGSDVACAEEQGENQQGGPREGDASGDVESAEKDEESVGMIETGKRKRDTPASPTSWPGTAPTKRVACLEEQPRRQANALELDPQPLRPEHDGAAGPGSGETSSPLEIESGTATRHPFQQQTRFLPSVQFPREPDAFARYPIRGRLKRPTNAIVDPNEERRSEGVPSSKRPRQDIQAHNKAVVTAGQDGMDPACPKEAIAGSLDHSALSGVSQTPRAQRSRAAGGVPRDGGSAFDLEPGWLHGMGLGLVPVMRVRAVHVPGGGDATYFASAYTSASESVICEKRSSPCFSFGFEELEIKSPGGSTKLTRGDETEMDCEPSGAREQVEGKRVTQKDAGNGETEGVNISVLPCTRQPGLEEERTANTEGDETIDRTEIVSTDDGDVDDGEIDIFSNGQADATPSSPRATVSVGGYVARTSGTGKQGGEEEEGSGGEAGHAVSKHEDNLSGVKGEADNVTEGNETEDVEISSDDVSCGGFEGAEAASPCISEDEDDGDFGRGWGPCLDRGDSSELASGVEIQSRCSTVEAPSTLALAGSSSGATEINQVLRKGLSVESGGAAAESPESPPDGDVAGSTGPARWKSTDLEATKVPGNTSGRGSEPMHVGGEPEIAVEKTPVPQQTEMTLALRSIVREQLRGVLRSASKSEEAALAGGDGSDVLDSIVSDTEDELFQRLYQDSTGGREYKAKYKQLLLALGNVRNYRLVASVLGGNTTPVDLATKDAVGLLNSLSSSLNVLAIPLTGRQRHRSSTGSPGGKDHNLKGKRRGKMQLL